MCDAFVRMNSDEYENLYVMNWKTLNNGLTAVDIKKKDCNTPIKELSWRGMTTTQVIDKLKGIVDLATYCEIEGYINRAICLLEWYRDEYNFVHKDDDV